jgi:hypothetical protein
MMGRMGMMEVCSMVLKNIHQMLVTNSIHMPDMIPDLVMMDQNKLVLQV